MFCDICLNRQAVSEAIYEGSDHGLLLLSVCDSFECQSKYFRVSNSFTLTNALQG